jgi:hypothetical protein
MTRRIKVTWDGQHPATMAVRDAETGEVIKGVQAIKIVGSSRGVHLRVHVTEFELEVYATAEERTPPRDIEDPDLGATP